MVELCSQLLMALASVGRTLMSSDKLGLEVAQDSGFPEANAVFGELFSCSSSVLKQAQKSRRFI